MRARLGLNAEEAFRWLTEVSQHTNRKIREISVLIAEDPKANLALSRSRRRHGRSRLRDDARPGRARNRWSRTRRGLHIEKCVSDCTAVNISTTDTPFRTVRVAVHYFTAT
ncbi:ANTAR domain-containing protein [Amycolatopsis sp. cmx-11-51]|uniref:ANTAR domain-containing protein n=1 Tax=unclassified Amycolatopsis TaxID=2618356 RepID=UPI0039E2A442